jgi:hypothetical protein
VFPLAPHSKVPFIPEHEGGHGCLDATINTVQIGEWWSRCPKANIGLATGAVSRIVVIDVDPAKGGDASIASLEAQHGVLPETLTVRTGHGGRHLYFMHPGADVRIKSSVALLGLPGLDVRGHGGYVVAPPSILENDHRYKWIISMQPAPLPAWLLALTEQRISLTPPPLQINRCLYEGARNATLASIAGALRRRGVTVEALDAALQAINAHQCEPPLPAAEVTKIARSIGRYAPSSTFSETSGGSPRVIEVA